MTDLKETDQRLPSGQIVREGKFYGCHIELSEGDQPDACIAVEEDVGSCVYGLLKSGRPRRSRWTCKYWRQVRSNQ